LLKMRRRVYKKPPWQRRIAKERIKILFSLALKEVKKRNYERARRYVELLRKIGKRYNVRLSRRIKRQICKNCNIPLIPGLTAKVRIDSRRKLLLIKCEECKKVYRRRYK